MEINKELNMKTRIKNKAIIFLLLCFVSCSNSSQIENDIDLINKVFTAVKEHNTGNISFSNLTNFDWDNVCIFSPYTPVDSINSALGFNWELSDKTNLQHDDVICLIVFMKGKDVVKYLLYPRSKGDFSALNERCYSREKAVYKVEERDNKGKVWYVIKNK